MSDRSPSTPCPDIILAERMQGRTLKEIAWRHGWLHSRTAACAKENGIRQKLAAATPSDDELVALVQKHNSLVGVAREYPFVNAEHIRRVLKARGMSFRNGRTPPWDISEAELFEIAERMASGIPSMAIAREYGVSNSTVQKHLARAGLPYTMARARLWFRQREQFQEAA
jgi:DNA-binding CsgD family transcriptional regulator